MQISKRLTTVASFVTYGCQLADIGTDHAYVPIYLVAGGHIPSAIAMDIRSGPLEIAKEHIREQKLCDKIEVRLSDGLEAYRQGEASSIVIAGMGGALIERILTRGQEKLQGIKELVLSPQSELFLVRKWLERNKFCIDKETMLIEDGKAYTIIHAVLGSRKAMSQAELYYGPCLLENKHLVLKGELEKEKKLIHSILTRLETEQGEHIDSRREELKDKLVQIEEALLYYEM